MLLPVLTDIYAVFVFKDITIGALEISESNVSVFIPYNR